MIKLQLPFWMSGEELTKLRESAQQWFEQVASWARWPLEQLDPLNCSTGILELIAWQRDITRFTGEPLAIFRKRVAYAYINAMDAGSTAGFARICQRLGIGHITTQERQAGWDWDIVNIYLDDEQLADNPDLLREIIRQYGRTCRRYNFILETPVSAHIRCAEVEHNSCTVAASMPLPGIKSQAHEVTLNTYTTVARLIN